MMPANPSTTVAAERTEGACVRRPAWGYWPAALGLAAALFQIITGVTADAVAITVAAAASCYLAVVAVLVSPRLGLAVAGVALASHAVWDHVHWRRDTVVPRSLAEFCFVLDIPFGVAAIVLAIAG